MKKVVSILLVALMLISAGQIFAQSSAALIFLLISPGARAVGLGETFVATADDATATYWNPAGLAFQRGRQISFMHTKWLPQLVDDMSYEFLTYRQDVESLGGTVGGHVIFMNYGEQTLTDETGPQPLGTFNSWDMAVTVSYASQLGENLGLGVNLKYIRSNLAPEISVGSAKGEGVANAFAVDLGVLYHMPWIKGLTFGANLSNLGPKVSYIDPDQADPLPTNLKIGFAYKVIDSEFNQLRVEINTNKLMVVRNNEESDAFYKALITSFGNDSFGDQLNALVTNLGAEYIYNNMIALRAGYYYDEVGQMKFPTFGAGLKYNAFRFDFGYMAADEGHPRADTMLFSLTADI